MPSDEAGNETHADRDRDPLSAVIAPEFDSLFWPPTRTGVSSDWWAHVPFAHWLAATLRPAIAVELGVSDGVSFAAFCEAVHRLPIAGKCYAIFPLDAEDKAPDNERTFVDLSAFARARYGEFSKVLRQSSAEAASHFADGSVDLLCFAAEQRGAEFGREFGLWAPKLSARAIVLVHGSISKRDAEAASFIDGLKARHPWFEFLHSSGLTLIAVGAKTPDPVLKLCGLEATAAQTLRDRLAVLGARWEAAATADEQARSRADAERRRVTKSERVAQLALSDRAGFLEGQLRRERAWNIAASERLKEIQTSRSWRVAKAVQAATTGWRTPVKTLFSGVSRKSNPKQSEAKLIRDSGLFDETFYEGAAEARAMGISPIAHYIEKGEAAGLAPSQAFDPVFYRESYPDLKGRDGALLAHYIRYGRQEGRSALSEIASLTFPTDRLLPERETVVVAIHEASRTGAPILGWNIIVELRKRYNVIVLLRKGGPIEQAFADVSSGIVVLPDDFATQPAQVDALAKKFVRLYSPKYMVANSIETRYFVPAFENAGVPTIALILEFCSNVRPLGTLLPLFQNASQIVFEAQIVADSALLDHRVLRGRPYRIMPQGMSRLPRNNPVAGAAKDAARDDFSVLPEKDGSLLVVGMGTITQRKGVEFFIAAAASVLRQRPNARIRFAWVGKVYWIEQEYLDYLNEQVQRSGAGACFSFVGEFEDLAPVYERADICFLSSRLDPLPNIAIDSAVHGIPLICFDQASGMAEILKVSDETSGLVVPYLDVEAAARLIVAMSDDPQRLAKWSQAMRAVAAKHFDMTNYVGALDRLGRQSVRAREQARQDFELIARSGAFNARLYLGAAVSSMSNDDAIRSYLRQSSLAAPRGRPWSHLVVRRPSEGFHPLIYAAENPGFDESSGEDPLAHYIRTGFPEGRWKHDVIRPGRTIAASAGRSPVAVHGHFDDPACVADFLKRLNANQTRFDLFVTTPNEESAAAIARAIDNLEGPRGRVSIAPARGGGLAALLALLRERTADYQAIGHFQAKPRPYGEAANEEDWRNFAWERLIGGAHNMMDVVVAALANDKTLGLAFPADPCLDDWNENRGLAEDLAVRMELGAPLPGHFDFPVSGMFWAKPVALAPLLTLDLTSSDFPEEPLPSDGALPHALVRLLPFSAARAGFRFASVSVDGAER